MFYGLSFYIIQKSIITAIKKTLFTNNKLEKENYNIDIEALKKILLKEKKSNL